MPPGRTWLIPVRIDSGYLPEWDLGAGRVLSDLNYVDLFGPGHAAAAVLLVTTIHGVMGEKQLSPAALKSDAVTQLVKNSTAVKLDTPSLIFDFAQAEISRLSRYLKGLADAADVVYEGEDREWLLGLTRVATESIDATSLTRVDAGGFGFVDGGLWSSDLGQRYLEAQREAVKRGVFIRRLFIVDRPELKDDFDFVSMLRQHVDIGVEVRTLMADAIVSTQRSSLVDFIVMDGVLSYQVTPGTRLVNRRPTIVATTLVTDEWRVRERIAGYEDLWNNAQHFPDSTT
jgi:hypothetical protein